MLKCLTSVETTSGTPFTGRGYGQGIGTHYYRMYIEDGDILHFRRHSSTDGTVSILNVSAYTLAGGNNPTRKKLGI